MKYLGFFAVALFSLLLFGCTSYSQPSPSPTAQLPTVIIQTPAPAPLAASTPAATIAQTAAPEATDGISQIPAETTSPAPSQQVQEFSISAKRFEYAPSAITLKKGVPAKLKITSMDAAHGFNLPAFGINKDLPPNQEVIIEFTPDKTGDFSFSCSVFCGSDHGGMAGKIIVTD